MKTVYQRVLVLLFCFLGPTAPAFADDEMDVDLSDTLNFEKFHENKDESIKLWDNKDKVEKTYRDDTSQSADGKSAAPGEAPAQNEAKTNQAVAEKAGKRYEIRELYSISGSKRTGYTPTTVVQALFLQMQGYCPNGWKKLDERSVPDGNDAFYMYYTFECL